MKIAKRIFVFVLCLAGIYFALDGSNSLLQGGGDAGAAGVTNGLLSVVAGILLINSGLLVWVLAELKALTGRSPERLR